MAEHTPGPWAFEERSKIAPDDLQRPWVGLLEESRYTAMACGSGPDEAWANARLIAAAPDLLAALKKLTNAIDSCIDLTPEVLRQAESAINKATGA